MEEKTPTYFQSKKKVVSRKHHYYYRLDVLNMFRYQIHSYHRQQLFKSMLLELLTTGTAQASKGRTRLVPQELR